MTAIIPATRETSESYIVVSSHKSEDEALKRARRLFGTGVVVIHETETAITNARWLVARPR